LSVCGCLLSINVSCVGYLIASAVIQKRSKKNSNVIGLLIVSEDFIFFLSQLSYSVYMNKNEYNKKTYETVH